MKIEIGESLIYSWLRHIKKCQIVQLNWKVSPEWDLTINEKLIQLFSGINSKYDNLFGKNRDIKATIRQAEVDVIGFNFNKNKIYCVDIAFHSNGLGYSDNVIRVSKKILRTVIILETLFDNSYDKEIIFATPKANPSENEKIFNRIKEIKEFLENKKIDVKVDFLSNEEFKNNILEPILSLSNEVADTSELFLRSYQLTKLFGTKRVNKTLIETKKASKKDITTKETNTSIKIGKVAKDTFKKIFDYNLLPKEEIENLMNKEYSKKVFDMNYPILKEYNPKLDFNEQRKVNGYDRYYAKIYGEKYLLSNDWYERNRKLFDLWCSKYIN